MNICQLTTFCLLIHGILIKVEAVNKKLQKSFVEIFGEGWDEEERAEEIGKVAGHWQNDGKQIQNNDQRETTTAIDDQAQSERSGKNDYNKKLRNEPKNENDRQHQQKREFVQKWYAIKEEIKQKKVGKWSVKEWNQIENLLAKKLGTNRDTIFYWISELGMGQKRSKEATFETMKKYWEMKRNEPKMSDTKIAKALKMNGKNLRKWKVQYGELKINTENQFTITDERKRKIVHAFWTIKGQIAQKWGKRTRNEWNQIDILLAKKLGTNRTYLNKWTREMGMSQRRTDEKRMALMKKYWAMKRDNPKICDATIAKALKICERTIRRWKSQFREELGMGKQKGQTIVVLDERKREIIRKWYAIKERIKQRKGKQSHKEWYKIDKVLAKKLDTNRSKIYEWIRELGEQQGQKATKW